MNNEDLRKKIYNLKLHESVTDNGTNVMRVPGGWMYRRNGSLGNDTTSVFVPFNDEFNECKPQSTSSGNESEGATQALEDIKEFCQEQIRHNHNHCELNNIDVPAYMLGANDCANKIINYIHGRAPWLIKK